VGRQGGSVEYLIVVAAYLAGSVPFALVIVKLLSGRDVRTVGSGNVGATNATRAAGWPAGLLVLVLDVAKGLLPVMAMQAYDPAARWMGATAVAAVFGHCFPIWLRFRGGKGIATGFGAFLLIAPIPLAAAAGVWVVVMAVGRVVSLASLAAAASFPIWAAFIGRCPPATVLAATLFAVLVIGRHHRNIRRLAEGTEPRLGDEENRDGKGDKP